MVGRPYVDWRVHVRPPSLVAQSAGRNAHPWRLSANRISVTPVFCSFVIGAAMTPICFHVVPPSVVAATAVHVFAPHVEAPSNQPWSRETHDCDCTRKPGGSTDPLAARATVADAPNSTPTTMTTTAVPIADALLKSRSFLLGPVIRTYNARRRGLVASVARTWPGGSFSVSLGDALA